MIEVNEMTKVFHLSNKNISYVFQIMKENYLIHRYWGKKIKKFNDSNKILLYDRGFCANPDKDDRTFSLDTVPREISDYGRGDFRIPMIEIERENGCSISDFKYQGYKIIKGKNKLEGLPSINPDEYTETIIIILKDSITGVELDLSYTVMENYDVILRNMKIVGGKEKVKINRALSAIIDFPHHNYDLVTLPGSHTREKNISRRPLTSDIQVVESLRGTSSPQMSPFIALCDRNADENQGQVFGFHLVYSGNFYGGVQVEQYGSTRVAMGIHPDSFCWILDKDEEFQTPEIIMNYSSNGFNGLSQTFHKLFINQLSRGDYQFKERPILINSWEAAYFDFDENKIIEIAQKAKELGMEMIVMDDGWFGKRNDDTTSLGDWFVNYEKLPSGLKYLVDKVNKIGIKFGIWFEPEMISPESELFKTNPDWYLHVPDYTSTLGRNQLVLDLSRQEVVDNIFEQMCAILDSANIEYIKWDMNRHLTEVGSVGLSSNRQKEISHRYVLGLYQLLERLTNRYPNVLFENCSSGGGRFDAGMMYYMQQTWTSDNTDAISRLKIQYGTSLLFPPIMMGSHVSRCPNNQVGRITPLSTRANVAMSGNLGYETDITKCSEEENIEISEQIKKYKRIRNTIQFGTFYRLLSPFEGQETAWNYISPDNKTVVMMYFRELSQPATSIPVVKMAGLDPDSIYQDIETNQIYGGDELMNVGITIPRIKSDFISLYWEFKKIN